MPGYGFCGVYGRALSCSLAVGKVAKDSCNMTLLVPKAAAAATGSPPPMAAPLPTAPAALLPLNDRPPKPEIMSRPAVGLALETLPELVLAPLPMAPDTEEDADGALGS